LICSPFVSYNVSADGPGRNGMLIFEINNLGSVAVGEAEESLV
jgi:hypothetical protein